MKRYILDKEEKKILADYEKGNFRSIKNKKLLDKYRAIARAHFTKRKINISVTTHDLYKLKEKAADKGVSYQHLASSVLHQYSDR